MKRFVYLGGPILACTDGEANDWRRVVEHQLYLESGGGIVGISPLRCEPIHGETYGPSYEDPRFGTPRAIASKNFFDVTNCDLAIIYIPKPPEGRHHSWGTMGELHWAHALGKMTILVTDDPEVRDHPVINASANWVVGTLNEAVDICVGVLGGYTGGKNV